MVWHILFREKLKTVSTDEGSDSVLKTETKISGSWEKNIGTETKGTVFCSVICFWIKSSNY